MSNTATAPKRTRKPAESAPATGTPAFMTPEAEEALRQSVRTFFAHTNNQGVLNEMETVIKNARDLMGWKHGGRILLEELKLRQGVSD